MNVSQGQRHAIEGIRVLGSLLGRELSLQHQSGMETITCNVTSIESRVVWHSIWLTLTQRQQMTVSQGKPKGTSECSASLWLWALIT